MGKITVYGIVNCDIIKKTGKWLQANKIETEFHDYKKLGVTDTKLSAWINKAGLETVMNKRSTTWRELPVEAQEKAKTEKGAIRLMMENTSLIKRPVIEFGDQLIIGYDEKAMQVAFKK